jgi:hypothetical protein
MIRTFYAAVLAVIFFSVLSLVNDSETQQIVSPLTIPQLHCPIQGGCSNP